MRAVHIRTSFRHRAKTWPHPRRILVKIDVTAAGLNVRFMVTNRHGRAADLIDWYDDRGTSENWIKELKLDIHADRLSCHRFRANAFRLQLHSLALLLLAYFRRAVLASTRFASATVGTIRLHLLKVAGRVVRSVRRLWFHLASSWPGQPLFTACHRALARAPA
jgi:Transposase DDE domain group 1